jgi:hypothetical protein
VKPSRATPCEAKAAPRDPVIVEAVGDIERLTTELSQKIWQKIVLAGGRQRHREVRRGFPCTRRLTYTGQ